MRSIRLSLLFVIVLLAAPTAHAQGNYRYHRLSEADIQRVRDIKALLVGVDTEPLQATIRGLEKSPHPRVDLAMKEAMARAFTDIVREVDVQGQKKKEWLYSMVCLNMAYLQFGGSQGKPGSTTELNRLIRKKLVEYLPPKALQQSGFVTSLE